MCEQAARYCRESVHRLLRKQQPQIGGLDGLLRWIVTKMSDQTSLPDRELLQEAAGHAACAPEQRKGASVILDHLIFNTIEQLIHIRFKLRAAMFLLSVQVKHHGDIFAPGLQLLLLALQPGQLFCE
uniref:Uncharacterized protein n=1 Tax=Sphaerodactylus townsendi TaxID=933632 RepID=A0ACB8EAP9_9SAUR